MSIDILMVALRILILLAQLAVDEHLSKRHIFLNTTLCVSLLIGWNTTHDFETFMLMFCVSCVALVLWVANR